MVLLSHVERGFSFPPSEFLLQVLGHYVLQSHHLPTNSFLEISGFVALCKGFLGVRPPLDLFKFYFQIKRQSVYSGGPLANCGSVSLIVRKNRIYPRIGASELVKHWTGSYFYCKDVPAEGLPPFKDGPATAVASWDEEVETSLSGELLLMKRRIEKLMKQGLKGSDLDHCWLSSRIQPLQDRARLLCEVTGDKMDKMRTTPHVYPPKVYISRLKALVKERDDQRMPPVVSMHMYIAQNPAPKLSELLEDELSPIEGYLPEDELANEDETDEQPTKRSKKRKAQATLTIGGLLTGTIVPPNIPLAKKAKASKPLKKLAGRRQPPKAATSSPATGPSTPAANASVNLEADSSHVAKEPEATPEVENRQDPPS